jgi:uncharacterized cupredoxin-like copper-binding protein
MCSGRYRRLGFVLAGVALAATPGCSTSQPDNGADRTRQVRVIERDFAISAPRRLHAGDIRLSIRNKGPDDHEFIVVRAQDPGLPLRADGLTVDEDALEGATAGALEPAPPGVHELRVHLEPGRYELLCNMSGHYMGGMHTPLVVGS